MWGGPCGDSGGRRINSDDVHPCQLGTRAVTPPRRTPLHVALDLGQSLVMLRLRRSHRARRVCLRIDPVAAGAELVLPRGVAVEDGLRFARSRRDWLASRLAALPRRTPFADGATIPVLGEMLIIRHRPQARGGVRRAGRELIVAGDIAHLARRVRDWLKAAAHARLDERSAALASRLGRRIAGLRLGDPKSRWGSCSPTGRLAYSWRLVLAPLAVLDYVVAHEVAHLVELDHGSRFWRLVAELAGEFESPRAWLKRHGTTLLAYG